MTVIQLKCWDTRKEEIRCHAPIDDTKGPIKYERRCLVHYVAYDSSLCD
jgi:hypothetical protein